MASLQVHSYLVLLKHLFGLMDGFNFSESICDCVFWTGDSDFYTIIHVSGQAFSFGYSSSIQAFMVHKKQTLEQMKWDAVLQRKGRSRMRQIRTGQSMKCKRNTMTFSGRLNCDQSSEVWLSLLILVDCVSSSWLHMCPSSDLCPSC